MNKPSDLPFHTVDVFTDIPFSGNPLAIVENADALSAGQMQTMAREFNLSETIFVQSPEDKDHTAKVRIFFPTNEIPFAGHPTIGCAIFLAEKQHADESDFETLITLEEVAGLVPVRVIRAKGKITAKLTAPVLPFVQSGQIPAADLAANALGVDDLVIGLAGHAIGLFQGGPAFLYIPVNSDEALGKISICQPFWSQMIDAANVDSAYVYTRDGNGFRSRMFSPTAGIPEDPATGSASAIFAAQLLASNELSDGVNSIAIKQGFEMGRPSHIHLEVDVERGMLQAVRIEGTSVSISSGKIRVPSL